MLTGWDGARTGQTSTVDEEETEDGLVGYGDDDGVGCVVVAGG